MKILKNIKYLLTKDLEKEDYFSQHKVIQMMMILGLDDNGGYAMFTKKGGMLRRLLDKDIIE